MDDIDRRKAADKQTNEGVGRRKAARAGERRAEKVAKPGKVEPVPQEAVALAALDGGQRAELAEAEAKDKARAEIAEQAKPPKP